MYVEFTERVSGLTVSRGARTMPESPLVGDVVSVRIDDTMTRCRVVDREWQEELAFPDPDMIVQVAQISQVATGGRDGETEAK